MLDNFCWGNTDRPETLGSLVRAARPATTWPRAGHPFISGKDSLNNEFRPAGGRADRHSAVAPDQRPGQVADVARCVTMDLKEPGNLLYLVGMTRDELGGSHFALGRAGLIRRPGARWCDVRKTARRTFAAIHGAITPASSAPATT